MRGTIVAAVLVACAALAAAKETDTAAETKLRAEAAKPVAEYAAFCAARGAKKDGTAAADEAASLDAEAPKLADTRAALDALAEDAAGAADAVAKQRVIAGPKVAAAYDRLAALEHDAKDTWRFEDYVFRALAWDPSAARLTKVRKAAEDAAGGGRVEEAGRLLVRLRRADAAGVAAKRYDKFETDLATKDALLLGASEHPIVGWVSLPKGWTKGKSYAVLVDVDGAGCNFLGSLKNFCGLRASRPVIVLAPVTFSNTNELKPETYPCYPPSLVAEWNAKNGKRHEFDGPGVDGLLDIIEKRFGGEEKVFLTGFSGGGQYTYWKLFQQPGKVRGAAPACANFGGAGLEGAPGAGEDGGPPVHLFTGEKDQYREHVGNEPGIEAQTDRAEENLRKLGYKRVERTQVKGVGHDALPSLVWKFVDQVMGAK